MRSVDDQLALVTDAATTPEPVRIGISNALGLMCAEQVQANQPLPGFPQAAIDGYAVRAVDIGGERGLRVRRHKDQEEQSAEGEEDADSPQPEVERSLPVVGEVPAGSKQPLRLQPKQAVRVYTGAPLPTLADAVLPLEWTDRGRKRVTAHRPVRSGDFVRRVGDDIQPGDVAVSSGTVLGPAQIGLLAAVGRSKVLVYPRPRITIISFGRELVDLDQEPALGQVFDVNSYSLAAAAREAGAEVHRVGIAEGEPRRIREALEKHIARSEVLVISGAVGGAGAEAIREMLAAIDLDAEAEQDRRGGDGHPHPAGLLPGREGVLAVLRRRGVLARRDVVDCGAHQLAPENSLCLFTIQRAVMLTTRVMTNSMRPAAISSLSRMP